MNLARKDKPEIIEEVLFYQGEKNRLLKVGYMFSFFGGL